MLKETSFVFGTLKKKGGISAKNGAYGIFTFSVNGEYFDVKIWGDYSNNSIGDFFCVEYAINDPSVAKLTSIVKCRSNI